MVVAVVVVVWVPGVALGRAGLVHGVGAWQDSEGTAEMTTARNPSRRGGCLMLWLSNFVCGVARVQTSVVPVVCKVVVFVVVVFVVISVVQVVLCRCMWWLVCGIAKSFASAAKGL